MKTSLFLLLLVFSSLSLFSQEEIKADNTDGGEPWMTGEPLGAYLSLADYGVPALEEIPLMDRVFTGDKPGRGYGIGIGMLTAGIGTLGGSLYYSLDRAQADSPADDVQRGLITGGLSVAGIGISSLVMAFFRDRMENPVLSE